MEKGKTIEIVPHGFVRYIDHMGSDEDIEEAARLSYGEGTRKKSQTRSLLRYLMKHWHTSPFEMAEVKFHLKLPIFIMRQLVRHRTANLNEYSARYSVLKDEFYTPIDEYIKPQSTTNKQGSGGDMPLTHKKAVVEALDVFHEEVNGLYHVLLGDDPEIESNFSGISRELARMVMPTSTYTECYWKIDLHNFFHFAQLRMDEHAQTEIRDLAYAMYEIVKELFPLAAEAFEDYRLNSKTLSRLDLIALKDVITNGALLGDEVHYGMSKREFNEFNAWILNLQNPEKAI